MLQRYDHAGGEREERSVVSLYPLETWSRAAVTAEAVGLQDRVYYLECRDVYAFDLKEERRRVA